jgi:hypothetical protein
MTEDVKMSMSKVILHINNCGHQRKYLSASVKKKYQSTAYYFLTNFQKVNFMILNFLLRKWKIIYAGR